MNRFLIPLLFLATLVGCASQSEVTNYVVSSKSTYLCCRTIRYATWPFSSTRPSTLQGEGVVVRLLGDTLAARCEQDAELGVVIANNGELDIYIPVSKEMEGDRIKLYPWRLLYVHGDQVRVARQLQYNDILEREDALLRFFRLPAGREVAFRGIIPARWLCSPLTEVSDEYLGYELNPTFYADRVKGLRGADYRRDPELRRSTGLRYEVAYTTLGYIDSLPVTSRRWSANRDTAEITINVTEEPAEFLNASQRVALSNTVRMKIIE